jgi:eukaryotic-like serine/threonine-protein kinase
MSDSPAITHLNAALEGRYRIESKLGEGGMATVYLVDDLKHERKVALKVLKPELAAVVGAERFLSEIKTTANLQHPNILPLFDSGEAGSQVFYVMPYVEGESLRDRLDREHQLPVDEAIRIVNEVADALQAAHDQGVVHRDIKPANIMLSRGRPLVADFGIALAVSSAGATRLTETGLSLGTPYYMSPEQATGDQVTGPATDTYALACVLYEMLVGEPPYTGSTAQAILGKIIMGGPVSATETRSSVPANVDAAIRKALEKLPADRFTSAQDFAKALADPGFRHREPATVGAAVSASPWKRLTIATTALSAGLVVALAVTLATGASSTPQVVHFTMPLGQNAGNQLGATALRHASRTSLAFSPDGALLVYAAREGAASSRLYLKRLDQEGADLIAGTEDAAFPFFSPDGDRIGFVRDGSLWRVSVADDEVVRIAESDSTTEAATWGDDGTIVFASFDRGLFRVPDTGGVPELVAEPSEAEWRYGQPHMLPGSEVVLFHASRDIDPELTDIVALDLTTGTRTPILPNAMDPRYVQTGHLLFLREGRLMAVAFDPKGLEVQGQPVIMVENVMHAVYMPDTGLETGAAQVAVSASGHLAYALGGVYPEGRLIAVRVTSTSDTISLNVDGLEMDRRDYIHLRVSPDGNSIAFGAKPRTGQNITVYDRIRGVTKRFNNRDFFDRAPVWSPDGTQLAFNSRLDGELAIYVRSAGGSGEPERLIDQPGMVMSWSSQGVAFQTFDEDEGRFEIWVRLPDGSTKRFFAAEGFPTHATFSPDGEWLAYVSDRSGRQAVYVRPYPGGEPELLIADDGSSPAWSPDGRKLYYTGNGALMAVDVTPGDELRPGRAVALIDDWDFIMDPFRGYDVFPDGSFVTWGADEDDDAPYKRLWATELHVVLNWFEVLKERVGN